ncbi:MAG: hypothetical protein GF346_09395 [Candidatus Eisenbacteria bacterium]|nr:hypothetical protein [Candidatus Latescibacterota bacterium]MBD3302646.1 hypothetical protein [Candidatus Eisenbacteria bacterium]
MFGYSSGPPDGFANDPPTFMNCTTCHRDYELNQGAGELAVEGLPPAFAPGTVYPLEVVLEDPGQQRWGFELTVLDAADEAAGTLAVVDPVNTALSDNPDSEADYLKHTLEGTYEGDPGPVSWAFEWTAPDVPGVTFYLTGNGADGDFTSNGDYIYAVAVELMRDEGTAVQETSWGRIKRLYRK